MKKYLKLFKDILETILYVLLGTMPITLPFLSCYILNILVNL